VVVTATWNLCHFVIDVDDLDQGVTFWTAALDATEEQLGGGEFAFAVVAVAVDDHRPLAGAVGGVVQGHRAGPGRYRHRRAACGGREVMRTRA
jgi:hypothetical protein